MLDMNKRPGSASVLPKPRVVKFFLFYCIFLEKQLLEKVIAATTTIVKVKILKLKI